jgi:hypothetical protein
MRWVGTLLRVLLVPVSITDVIDKIDASTGETKIAESHKRLRQKFQVQKLLRKEERSKYEHIFHPFLGSDGGK